MKKAYISIIFANRNDNYGGDQAERFQYFIDYYAEIVKKHPDLFEFVICDWNPPKNCPSLLNAYEWKRLGRVRAFSVSEEIHERYAKGCKRPFFDYIARNACILRGKADWMLVLNQDIFLAPELIDYLAKKQLNPRYFYRADRVDFDFEKIKGQPIHCLVDEARKNVTKRHIRPVPFTSSDAMSPTIDANSLKIVRSAIFKKDIYDAKNKLIDSKGYQALHNKNTLRKIFFKKVKHTYYLKFGMHTNAAGDFILATKDAFHQICGFPETADFYMHTDSLAIAQLFAAGFSQAIFREAEVFHADHARTGHSIVEKWQFKDHERWMSNVCYGARSYQFNGQNWGLRDFDLEIQEF